MRFHVVQYLGDNFSESTSMDTVRHSTINSCICLSLLTGGCIPLIKQVPDAPKQWLEAALNFDCGSVSGSYGFVAQPLRRNNFGDSIRKVKDLVGFFGAAYSVVDHNSAVVKWRISQPPNEIGGIGLQVFEGGVTPQTQGQHDCQGKHESPLEPA